MSSTPPSTPEEPQRDTDAMTAAELTGHVLAGAGDRVRAAVERLTRMGVIDESGKVLPTVLPRDIRPDSQATVVTG